VPVVSAVFIALAAVAILATVIPLSRADAWWVRALDFPRLQIGALALVALAGLLLVGERSALDRALAAALIACTLYQAYKVYPYTRLARPEVQRSDGRAGAASIRLMLVNVLMDNRRADALREIVRAAEPDVLIAAETDRWWAEQLEALAPSLPHAVAHPLDNTYGIVLRSRLPLVDPRVRFLVQDDVPSVHTKVRLATGDEIELHGVHPRPPAPTENDRSTERDAELLVVGKSVKGLTTPVIVAGDLNDVAWSRTTRLFQKVSGLLDPRIGRSLLSTFHARYPFLRWPLDHVFHSRHFRLRELRRLPRFGSDHFPVLVVLSLEPDAAPTQEPPRADAGDHQEAAEKIAKAADG
jgi:endonuclease/exonuclease/phosphatase (EEP) superfamily protein YafD